MVDPQDVCAYGHQLAPGSERMVLKEFDAEGRKISEKVVLLRNHACMGPGGLYQGGTRVVELDQGGKVISERVEGANPADHGLSVTDPARLIPYPCAHAIPREAVEDPSVTDSAGAVPGLAGSFGRAHWLTFENGVAPVALIARCPVCRGEPAPDWRA